MKGGSLSVFFLKFQFMPNTLLEFDEFDESESWYVFSNITSLNSSWLNSGELSGEPLGSGGITLRLLLILGLSSSGELSGEVDGSRCTVLVFASFCDCIISINLITACLILI